MFQSARPNSKIYLFFQNPKPRFEQGVVTVQPTPRPKYHTQQYGQPQETVVDLTVKTDSGMHTFFGIPTDIEVANVFCNGESVVISDNKSAMTAELSTIKQKSQETIDNISFHEETKRICDEAIGILNPEVAEKHERDLEFSALKQQVGSLTSKLDLLIEKLSVNTAQ